MFQYLFGGVRGGNSRPRVSGGKRTLLRIEGLEDRCTPANFVVNTVSDTPDANPGDGHALDANGETSLRAAIMEGNSLNGPHNITFSFPGAESSQDTTITLLTALPALERTYVIDGQVSGGSLPGGGGGGGPGGSGDVGVEETEIPGEGGGGGTTTTPPGTVGLTVTIARAETAGNFRLFTVDPPASSPHNLTLMNLTLTGGKSVGGPGGAVYMSSGELTMTHCTVANNSSDAVGGGVAVMGRVTITGCDFWQNSGSNGGALRLGTDSAQPSVVEGSLFRENEGWKEGGGAISYLSLGGAGTFQIRSTDIVNNRATATVAGTQANGGAILALASFAFEGGSITGNTTTGHGGGFYVYGTNANVAMNGLTLTDNKCDMRGGAFYVEKGNVVITSPLAFTGNTSVAIGFDGGVFKKNQGTASVFQAPPGSQTVVEDPN